MGASTTGAASWCRPIRKGATCTFTTGEATGHTVAVPGVEWSLVELARLDRDVGDAVAETLATWHAAEWGHLYDPRVWNADVARHEFAEQRSQGGGRPPTTYVALTHDGRLVGSVSLVTSDDLEGFDHLGPWLASLYVDESWRRRGVGRRLVQHLLDQEPARLAGAVYLFTANHAGWYAGLGWATLATTVSGPHAHPVTVMVRRSGEAADSEPLRHRGV